MSEYNLNTVLSFSVIVFIILMTIFGIYLIASVRKFIHSVQKIENLITELSGNLTPVISNCRFISDDLKSISVRTRSQFNKVEDLSENLLEKGTVLLNTLDQIQNAGNYIIVNSSNFVNAVRIGFSSFTNKLKNRSALLKSKADPFNY